MNESAAAGAARTLPGERIDVHAHHIPEVFREAAHAANLPSPDGRPDWPAWSAGAHLEQMDRIGIAVALLSLSAPGTHWSDDDAARRLSRRVNEALAETIRDHPGRFGGFVDLPLPNVEAALEEIEHGLDVLGLDGVCLLTNYRGIYLGDPQFDPVFEELERRSAVAFVHPNDPPQAAAIALGRPFSMIEYPFDTTRAVSHLVLTGTLEHCRSVRFILPHAGGALPYLVARLAVFAERLQPDLQEPVPAALARLYYDTAIAASAHQFASLLQLVDVGHVVYGSDFPWAAQTGPANAPEVLAANPLLTDDDLERIGRLNALALFPRLAAGV